MQELPIGAHLTSRRWGYTHHGLYAGDGRVIHYAGFHRLFRRGPVEEVSLERFARGRALALAHAVAPRFSGAAAVERARSRLGEDRYRLWSNNCEHFVTWALSGEGRSRQVDAWRVRLRRPAASLRSLLAVGVRRRRARAASAGAFQLQSA